MRGIWCLPRTYIHAQLQVRQMKKDGAAPEAITKEVEELKRLKKELKALEDAELALEGT